jgi:hypothetical protein
MREMNIDDQLETDITRELIKSESFDQIAAHLYDGAYEYAKANGEINTEDGVVQFLERLKAEFPTD